MLNGCHGGGAWPGGARARLLRSAHLAAERIVEDLNAGQPVLRDKQLRYRASVDPNVQSET